MITALLSGTFAPHQASVENLQRYHHVLHLSMTYFASAFHLWKNGLLSDTEWASNLSMLSEFKGSEGFRLWWPAAQNFYNPDFIEAVDSTPVLSTGLERFIDNVRNSAGTTTEE